MSGKCLPAVNGNKSPNHSGQLSSSGGHRRRRRRHTKKYGKGITRIIIIASPPTRSAADALITRLESVPIITPRQPLPPLTRNVVEANPGTSSFVRLTRKWSHFVTMRRSFKKGKYLLNKLSQGGSGSSNGSVSGPSAEGGASAGGGASSSSAAAENNTGCDSRIPSGDCKCQRLVSKRTC